MSGEMRLISKAGKTFYFATLWLEKAVRYDAALAYDFCRKVDDIADAEPARPDRRECLHAVAEAVLRGDGSHDLIRPLMPLITRYPEVREPLGALVKACCEDVPGLCIRDENDLERYSFGVAGNVGLIMYPILGGSVSAGRRCAADLGIAMQCTNIARDVLEDLRRGRVYLPDSWLLGCDIQDVQNESSGSESVVVEAVQKLLRFADSRYESGLAGLHYLAPQNRFAIRIAARCYAAIGERVITSGRLSRTRAVVPLTQKIVLACKEGFFPNARSQVVGLSS
jgi:phytoene synthase